VKDRARIAAWHVLLVSVLTTCGVFSVGAKPWSHRCSPEFEFTNIAALLLDTQLGVAYGRLQVYPTNEYTPAVHRLL